MRTANTEIITTIKSKTLALLMKKNPDEIGMRDIAANCGITAANIYHYYKDKDTLFQEISLDCLNELNQVISENAKKGKTSKIQILRAINSYRDWCFSNPRKALIVMQGIKPADDADESTIEKYYVCNRTGTELLERCIEQGIAKSANPKLDVGILVSGLWGCIESVLLKRADTEYWEKGNLFTDRFIKIWLDTVFTEEEK